MAMRKLSTPNAFGVNSQAAVLNPERFWVTGAPLLMAGRENDV